MTSTSDETTEAKPAKPIRQMATITCARCGKEDKVPIPIPRFCNRCWTMLRDRRKDESAQRIKDATNNRIRLTGTGVVWQREPDQDEATLND